MRAYSGYFFIFLAAFFWALIGPVARFSLGSGLDPLELAFWRAALGGGLFLLHALLLRGLKIHTARDGCVFALFGAVSMGGFFTCQLLAINYGGAALACVLLYTAPVWVAVFSRFFFKDELTLVKGLAIALSLAGVVCISLSSPDPEILDEVAAVQASTGSQAYGVLGLIFGLLSGLLYSTHFIFTKSYLAVYRTHTLYGYSAMVGAVALFPFVQFSAKTAADWAVVLCLGLVSTYGAYLAYCAGIRRLEATKAAVLATLEPVIATGLAWWLWGEIFGPGGYFGAVLVFAAVILLVRGGGEGKSPAPEEPRPRGREG